MRYLQRFHAHHLLSVGALVSAGIAIGAVFVFVSSQTGEGLSTEQTLTGRTTPIGDRSINLEVPTGAREVRSNDGLVNFVKENADIRIVSVGLFPTFPADADYVLGCNQNATRLLAATMSGIAQSVVLCENPLDIEVSPEFQREGYVLYGSSGVELEAFGERTIVIQVMAKRSYAESREGQAALRRIIESFELREEADV